MLSPWVYMLRLQILLNVFFSQKINYRDANSHQLYITDVKFIYRLLNCHNCIVTECLTVGINNSNIIIGYKLAFI